MNIEQQLADYVGERLKGLEVASSAVAAVADDEVACVVGGKISSAAPDAVTPETPFHICSCSKAFTALTFAALVENGMTAWDDRALDVVPEFQLADANINAHCTFRDLAGMRVGLERDDIAEWGFRPEAPVTQRLSRARAMRRVAPFRDRFSYSNLSYIALACAISRIAGKSFADCVRDYIFQPLGLRTASVEASGITALPHLPSPSGMLPVPELTGVNSQGSARVYLSARDAGRWLHFNLALGAEGRGTPATELLSPQSAIRPAPAPTAGIPTPYAYGFGWQLSQLERAQLLQHGGGGRGWRSMAVLHPARRRAVMVMLAHEDVSAEALALEIMELLNGKTPTARTPLLAARADQEARVRNAAQRLPRHSPPHAASVPTMTGRYANAVTGCVDISRGTTGAIRFAANDAPAFDATLEPSEDSIHLFRFDSPAMRTMPRDPPFEARFTQRDGRPVLETTYFGTLERLE